MPVSVYHICATRAVKKTAKKTLPINAPCPTDIPVLRLRSTRVLYLPLLYISTPAVSGQTLSRETQTRRLVAAAPIVDVPSPALA